MAERAVAIRLIHRTGGGCTAIGATASEAKLEARRRLDGVPNGGASYVLCTLPYPVERHRAGIWCTTLPDDVKEAIGEEMVRLDRFF